MSYGRSIKELSFISYLLFIINHQSDLSADLFCYHSQYLLPDMLSLCYSVDGIYKEEVMI